MHCFDYLSPKSRPVIYCCLNSVNCLQIVGYNNTGHAAPAWLVHAFVVSVTFHLPAGSEAHCPPSAATTHSASRNALSHSPTSMLLFRKRVTHPSTCCSPSRSSCSKLEIEKERLDLEQERLALDKSRSVMLDGSGCYQVVLPMAADSEA